MHPTHIKHRLHVRRILHDPLQISKISIPLLHQCMRLYIHVVNGSLQHSALLLQLQHPSHVCTFTLFPKLFFFLYRLEFACLCG